jgi:mono/diheme cytochrome c family protein
MVACIIWLWAGLNPAVAADGDIAKGQAIAQARCGRCHATGLNDASTNPGAPAFRSIADRYPVESLAEALAEGIMTGHPDMPQFVFEPTEISDFLTYLDDLNLQAKNKP